MHPGSVGAARDWRIVPDQTMLPQPAGATGASDCSPGPRVILGSAAAPQDSLSRPAAGRGSSGRHWETRQLPEAGRVLQTLLEIHRHLHLASAWPHRQRRRIRGSCGTGVAVAPGIRVASAGARLPLGLRGAAEGAALPGHSSREDCNGSAGPGRLFLRPS